MKRKEFLENVLSELFNDNVKIVCSNGSYIFYEREKVDGWKFNVFVDKMSYGKVVRLKFIGPKNLIRNQVNVFQKIRKIVEKYSNGNEFEVKKIKGREWGDYVGIVSNNYLWD